MKTIEFLQQFEKSQNEKLDNMQKFFDLKIEGMKNEIDEHFKHLNGKINDHETRLRCEENYTNKQKGMVALISATSGIMASLAIWIGEHFFNK